MNYGQVRDQILKLLNQYTRAGTPVESSYNNQQDYLNRIPGLVNDAMTEIATTARKIPTTLKLGDLRGEALDENGEKGDILYELPDDFYQLISGSIVTTKEGKILRTNQYTLNGRKYLAVPRGEAGNYTVGYYRYPNLLPEKPRDTEELDNEVETHYSIPFYVAAMLVIHDDAFLYASFYNKYEDKLAKMGPGVTAEVSPTQDVYSFFG